MPPVTFTAPPPPPQPMDVAEPAPEPVPEPMQEEPERDAPAPVAPEEDAPPAPVAAEAPESEMPPRPAAPETAAEPWSEPEAAAREPSSEPEEPEAADEPWEPEAGEDEAAALLAAATTTVATAAARAAAETNKPDKVQLEIAAARAARDAPKPERPEEPEEPDAAAKPPLTEDARALVARAAPIEVLQDNPKKGESAKRFRKYMAATTAAEFVELGGSRADLKYDIARGWVIVTDRAPPPPRAGKAKKEGGGDLVFEQNVPKLRSQVPVFVVDDAAIAAALVEEEKEVDLGPKEPAEWRTSGPFVGQWITRSILDANGQVQSFSVGQVNGYLNSKESDYLDINGRATALWRVDYVSGELKDDAEDLERHEILQSAPKPSRPDLSMKEVEAQSARLGSAARREGPKPKGKAKEAVVEYVPPVESEYERHRRERIVENQKFLQSLGFTGGDVGLPAMAKKTRGPRKKREPQAPTRRSSRATHEAGQYNENRQYRDAIKEVREEQRLVAQKRQEGRLEKRMAHQEEADIDRMRKRVKRLTRAASAAEAELVKRASDDASKLRQVGSKPKVFLGGGPVDERTAKTLDRSWCARSSDALQVGDVVVYFAKGHEESLHLRSLRSGFACGYEWSEQRTPSWFLQPGAPEVLECVVAAVEPRFPDEWLKRRREAFLNAIESLEGEDDAHWFLQPLDHQALGLYDYLKVVKRPMDLASLKFNVTAGQYDNDGFDNQRQFSDDLKRPFDNAILYNEEESDVAASARVMLEKAEALIEGMMYEEPPDEPEVVELLPPLKKRRFAGRWVEEEEDDLKRLVEELGDARWEQVAEQLGTGRSTRGAEQHWEVMQGTHAFVKKRKGPGRPAGDARSPAKRRVEQEAAEIEEEVVVAEEVVPEADAAADAADGGVDAVPEDPPVPPLKMELVVRLVPLYMVRDAEAAGADFPEGSGVTAIHWQTWRGGNLVDPFFVALSGHADENAFLQHRHRVLAATKAWRDVDPWASVGARDDALYRLESLRRAEKKSAAFLPAWRAAKLLECGLPDEPPPPPSKRKPGNGKKRKLTKGAKKKAPPAKKETVEQEEDPRLLGVNVWDLRELDDEEKSAAANKHDGRPAGYDIVEEPAERTTRGKKRELVAEEAEEPDVVERPSALRPEAPPVDLPLELDILDENIANALIEALAAVRSTEAGSRYWRSWNDDGGYSSEEDDAGNQIKRSGPGVRAMRQKRRAEEQQEQRLAKLLPRAQRAAGAGCLKDVQRTLMKNGYRRVEAVFDDVARVYRDSAQAAKDQRDPDLLPASLCVQLCFEVMEDAATSVGAGEAWRPKTRELANQAAALRPQPWQSHVRRTQSMKTNTGVLIRENVKLGVGAAIKRDKARPLQNACIASELHLALAIYVGNAAGPCKETAGRVLDVYGDWHLGADRKEASDVVTMVPNGKGRIEGKLVEADEDEVQERRVLVGRKFKRQGISLDIGTVQDYNREAKKYRASYADGGEELISIGDVTSGLLAFLPSAAIAALDASAAARGAVQAAPDAPDGAGVGVVEDGAGEAARAGGGEDFATSVDELVPDAPPAPVDEPPAAPADEPPAAPADEPPAAPVDAMDTDEPPERSRSPQGDTAPAVTRGGGSPTNTPAAAAPEDDGRGATVTIRCGGTKLWCARDARELLKALAAFSRGAPKAKKFKKERQTRGPTKACGACGDACHTRCAACPSCGRPFGLGSSSRGTG